MSAVKFECMGVQRWGGGGGGGSNNNAHVCVCSRSKKDPLYNKYPRKIVILW